MLVLDGEERALNTLPLDDYFGIHAPRPPFCASSTMDWRGHSARWVIVDSRLYLTALHGQICTRGPDKRAPSRSGCRVKHFGECSTMPVSMADFFPVQQRVFADWYSGELIMPDGKMTKYVHAGFASTYERYLVVTVLDGSVTSVRGEDELSTVRSMQTIPTETQPEPRLTWWQTLWRGLKGKSRAGDG